MFIQPLGEAEDLDALFWLPLWRLGVHTVD